MGCSVRSAIVQTQREPITGLGNKPGPNSLRMCERINHRSPEVERRERRAANYTDSSARSEQAQPYSQAGRCAHGAARVWCRDSWRCLAWLSSPVRGGWLPWHGISGSLGSGRITDFAERIARAEKRIDTRWQRWQAKRGNSLRLCLIPQCPRSQDAAVPQD